MEARVRPGKKNAKARGAWIAFVDESGISERGPVRSTWAPRGQTPFLSQPFNWRKASVIALLAYRADGKECRLYFKCVPGAFNAVSIRAFLREVQRKLPGPVILIWDRLQAHRAGKVQSLLQADPAYWAGQHFLPAYWPELNPVEPVWNSMKGRELANRSEPLQGMLRLARSGLRRVGRSSLPMSFLTHCGMSLP